MARLWILFSAMLLACSSNANGPEGTPPTSAPAQASATRASTFSVAPDEWDFYPTTINSAPASVMLNFWFGERAPIKGFGHVLWVFIKMDTPGAHRMGDAAEAAATGPLEDKLSAHLQTGLHAHFVGRIRGEGNWKLYFYGRRPDGFETSVDAFMKKHPARAYTAGHESDADWKTFKTVIFPDDERRRWIADNSVVEQLRKHGDPLTEARRVDHWIYFKEPAPRDAFEAAAKAAGFAVQKGSEVKGDDGRYRIKVHRKDFVDIGRIHSAVMVLHKLASQHGGDYDGWETAVMKAAKPK